VKELFIACAFSCLACGGGSDQPKQVEDLPLLLHPGNFMQEEQPLVPLSEGGTIDLAIALQGGHVMYVGAQAENFRSTQANIHTRLSHPDTLALRKEDQRTIVMKPVDGKDGVKQPDLRSRSQVSHLLTCPNDGSRDIMGQSWLLEIEMQEVQDGNVEEPLRSGSTSLHVTPKCQLTDAAEQTLCLCECAAGYVPGKCVSP
jgi:hypothetical protein